MPRSTIRRRSPASRPSASSLPDSTRSSSRWPRGRTTVVPASSRSCRASTVWAGSTTAAGSSSASRGPPSDPWPSAPSARRRSSSPYPRPSPTPQPPPSATRRCPPGPHSPSAQSSSRARASSSWEPRGSPDGSRCRLRSAAAQRVSSPAGAIPSHSQRPNPSAPTPPSRSSCRTTNSSLRYAARSMRHRRRPRLPVGCARGGHARRHREDGTQPQDRAHPLHPDRPERWREHIAGRLHVAQFRA